jgi:hypothetical protein
MAVASLPANCELARLPAEFDPVPGSEQFKLQQTRATEASGVFGSSAFLQQSGRLENTQELSFW